MIQMDAVYCRIPSDNIDSCGFLPEVLSYDCAASEVTTCHPYRRTLTSIFTVLCCPAGFLHSYGPGHAAAA